eukprot:CAMPEP_0171072982 /NCGR_PEP_ID=MMETSP0766_2-20121228/11218_1 /TAXON_ID=439317 /ORGANISM="Gambierdiscus australes, Strain CAWD 149" /LENGTH=189 /DNA_ID=CAMNT_0011529629 /DNA_START=228 /DNA_END=798 /DNA_ORIENTATION=-
MATLRGLVEERAVCTPWDLCLHPGCHLPRVRWVHSVVARGCGEEDRWVGLVGMHVVVGGALPQEGPVGGIVGVAILCDPGGASKQLGVPLHVQEGDAAVDGPEELRVLDEHVANQEAAVATTHGSQLPCTRHTRLHEVLCHRSEVLVRLVFALPCGHLVPLGSELTAPTYVCKRKAPPLSSHAAPNVLE